MAEVVGLVIGGVSLAALFDQCISIIKYADSGIHCGEAYQDAALMITLLGGRLSRWERAYPITRLDTATEEDGENAEHWLKQIQKRLQEAVKLGERYVVEPPSAASYATVRSKAISTLVHRLQEKLLIGGDGLSLGQKTRWALRDEDKMDGLIQKLDRLITSLERLSPGLQDQRNQIATADAAAVVAPLDVEGHSEALEALKAAAARVDESFNVAAATTSHFYRNIEIYDGASVSNGNYYSEQWAKAGGAVGQGEGHDYDGVRIRGQGTKVQNGNVFGGVNVFST